MIKKIKKILKKTTGFKENFSVFAPDKESFGHYSTNLALLLPAPDKLISAQKLARSIERNSPAGFFEKIEVAPPGFLNFWLSQKTLIKELRAILRQEAKYGASKILAGRKIQLEFISANPTGPLTLANGRGGFLGDVLGNVLKKAGGEVEKEYYVNDTGNQILTLGKSILAAAGLIDKEESFYKGNYISDWTQKNINLVQKLKDKPLILGEKAAQHFLKTIKQVIEKKAKIKFDRYTSEKKIHESGLLQKTLKIFKEKNLVYEKDGATWLKTTLFGDDKDRVLITRDNFPTYFFADAAHYLLTKKRGFDAKINILGPDHYGYVKRIQAVAKILKIRKSEVIITQAIRLVRAGKEIKMSKRKGEFVTFEELIDEVGLDAARFFFLAVAPETHIDFDLDLAKERSNKNPVFYLQYAFVRARNILQKAKLLARVPAKLNILASEIDSQLLRKLISFPDILEETAIDYKVHRLTQYAISLAADFHNFYEKERIIGEEKSIAAARYQLVKAAFIVLTNLLDILGITKPRKM